MAVNRLMRLRASVQLGCFVGAARSSVVEMLLIGILGGVRITLHPQRNATTVRSTAAVLLQDNPTVLQFSNRCVRAHLPACMRARTRTHAALVQIAGGCASRVQRLDAIVATLTGTHLLMSTAHSGTYMSARTVAHTVYSLSRASLPVVPFGRRL